MGRDGEVVAFVCSGMDWVIIGRIRGKTTHGEHGWEGACLP